MSAKPCLAVKTVSQPALLWEHQISAQNSVVTQREVGQHLTTIHIASRMQFERLESTD